MADRAGSADHRRELLEHVHGNVVEIGAGLGSNFKFYPDQVDHIKALEPEPYLAAKAEQEADRIRNSKGLSIEVLRGDSNSLPIDNGWADVVVFSLVLCSIANPIAALAEARRVLKPSGFLTVYEHVRSEAPKEAARQDFANRLWPRLLGGCNCNRNTPQVIADCGFDVTSERRFRFKAAKFWIPVEPHVILEAHLRG